jgi:PKHD-type hydroxylase
MGRYTAFRVFPAVLPDYLCDGIVEDARGLESNPATIGTRSDNYINVEFRKTQVTFWPADHWVSGLLSHFAVLANADLWRYEISLVEKVQFGTYEKEGYYDWHKDEFDEPYDEAAPEHWRGLARKLSVSVNLSGPDDYEGGDLLMKDTWGKKIQGKKLARQIRRKGTVIVFPSYILHTARPVTAGARHSLVAWVLGPPFS